MKTLHELSFRVNEMENREISLVGINEEATPRKYESRIVATKYVVHVDQLIKL